MEFSKSYLRYRSTTTNTSSLATVLIAVVTIKWNLTCSTVTIARDYWLSVLIILCTTSTEAFFLNDPYQRSIMIHPKGTTFTAAAKVFREKAKTFGQSAEEIQKVNYYLRKIQNLEAKQHPEETIQRISASLSARASEAVAVEVAKFEKRLKDSTSVNPEENGRYFEGDIILDVTQARDIYESMLQHGRRIKRKFIRSELRRWDSRKPIFYSFDGSHTTREQRVIELALEHWHNITCLNFERRDDEIQGNRIVFTDVDGCASNVGRHPLGEPQFVSLAPECIRLGVIAHEVAHALGFWHEQSRPDRDNYVTVRWENIDRDSKGQFLKELPTEVDNGGVPYDYGSIMHYRSKAFGRYEDLFTLNTNIADYQKTIGQRDQLSFNDIRLMNIIYCKNSCIQQLPCQRGGYTDPRRCDRCRCPDGFTGKLCDQVMPGFGADCGGRMELTSSWKRITSPNYPNEFKEGQECSWLLVAPLGQRVQLRFYGEFEMYCKVRHSLCMDYIEIRNSTDFANTGMRYCCFGTPQSLIMSATEDMLVLFRSFYRGGKGFQAQVRALPTTGLFSAWSQWSACSASCGACGIRHRRRTCVGGACFVEESNSEVCGRTACSGLCAYKIFEKTRCGGFLALFNNMKCRRERTVLEPCKIYCYPGYIAHKWTLFMIHKYAYVINNSTNTHR